MFFETIKTAGKPATAGPCSPGLLAGDFLAVSAQLPIDLDTGSLCSDDICEQMKQCLRNVFAILQEHGLGMRHIMNVHMYLTNMEDAEQVYAIYAQAFEGAYPALSCIGVNSLMKGAKVQLEAFAIDTRALEILCAGQEHGSCEGCGGC